MKKNTTVRGDHQIKSRHILFEQRQGFSAVGCADNLVSEFFQRTVVDRHDKFFVVHKKNALMTWGQFIQKERVFFGSWDCSILGTKI
jgi:hypothetical protein